MFFSTSVNAARGIAYQVLHALTGFVNNFQMAMNPQIVKSYAANEKKNMFKLVFYGSKFSYLLLFMLSLPVLIETPFILDLWLKNVPEYTIVFLRLILVSSIIDSLSGPLITSMHASGKVRDYQIIVGGVSLITLPIVYVLLRNGCEPYMAMVVVCIMSIICLFARLVLLKYMINLPIKSYILQVLLRILPITMLAPIMPIIIYSEMQVGWLSFLLVCMVSIISVGVCSFYISLKNNEKTFVINKLKNITNNILKLNI